MAKEFWNNLAELYASVNSGGMGGAQPPGQMGGPPPAPQGFAAGGMAEEGPVQGYEEGGLVDNWTYGQDVNPTYDYSQKDSPSSGWFSKAATGFLGDFADNAAGAATGMLINKMFPGTPGKTRLLDTRHPEMQQGAGMAMDRLRNLQANPNSFGLPGDPNDINTPAGKRLAQIRSNRRNADAARGKGGSGALETGGSALRETEDVNDAIGKEYNSIWNSGFGNLAQMTPQMQINNEPGTPNPWAGILTSALAGPIGKAGRAGATGLVNLAKENKWIV